MNQCFGGRRPAERSQDRSRSTASAAGGRRSGTAMTVEGAPHAGPAAPDRPRVVAAAAQHDEARRFAHQRPDHAPVRVVGEGQARERVLLQRIGAALEHDRLRPEMAGDGQHRPVQQPEHLAVVEAGRDGQVPGVAAGPVLGRAGVGPAPLLVNAEGEDTRVVAEGVLDAVAVVRVDVHVEEAVQATVEPGEQAEHRVVEVAEAAGPRRLPVMRAATGHMDGAAAERQPRREGGASGPRGGAGKNLVEDRIALRADGEALAVGRVHALGGLGALEGGDVVRMVEARERVRRRARAFHVAFRVEPAEGADQVERGGNARDGERVLRPVSGAAVDLRADQQRRRAARVREHGRPPVQ